MNEDEQVPDSEPTSEAEPTTENAVCPDCGAVHDDESQEAYVESYNPTFSSEPNIAAVLLADNKWYPTDELLVMHAFGGGVFQIARPGSVGNVSKEHGWGNVPEEVLFITSHVNRIMLTGYKNRRYNDGDGLSDPDPDPNEEMVPDRPTKDEMPDLPVLDLEAFQKSLDKDAETVLAQWAKEVQK